LLGSTAASLILRPLAVRAQQPRMPVIGYLGPESPDRLQAACARFATALPLA
jgi:hypothetical protein